jgi:hypothetical protein
MSEPYDTLGKAISLQALAGYLNFGSGKPDARFEKQLSDAFAALQQSSEPWWQTLHHSLRSKLEELQTAGGAFQDVAQARSVLTLVSDKLMPAYRQHHADLLFHLADAELYQPFFLARLFEAVLLQGGPWEDDERIVTGALTQLNDYVGHRPIAILETRPRAEPYDHERVRPIPLFLRGAGVACGRYRDLLEKALAILAEASPDIRAEAFFDLELMDEFALDPRAYNHGHPANRRPNYVFGEWDPHHIDNQGRYRRYVARQVTLDGLLERVEQAPPAQKEEFLFEAAAVLAGTVLMSSGTSGSGPETHDSTVTLTTLAPRIARYRDAFYTGLLEKAAGATAEQLRQDAVAARQPFGGARQHLNRYLGRQRAMQLSRRHLALLFARMGFADAAREQSAAIPAASTRIETEIMAGLAGGHLHADRGEIEAAARALPEIERLVRRGIECGALADPWNVLGFQGLYPIFQAREDSVRDTRIDDLIDIIAELFHLYARLASESASQGQAALSESILAGLRREARWWDKFASTEVGDVDHVHGGETLASAEHVATALARWHAGGEKTADLQFWRDHVEGFQSSKSFALVVDALLRKDDYPAAMGLLMSWLGQAEAVPLEDGEYSFHTLALRWMLGASSQRDKASETVHRFLEHLEANAEEFWTVPALGAPAELLPEPEQETGFESAYEGVTFQDSTDDLEEGGVAEGEYLGEFELDGEVPRLIPRLQFLSTLAKLWQIAAQNQGPEVGGQRSEVEGQKSEVAPSPPSSLGGENGADVAGWLALAEERQSDLQALMDALHDYAIPAPLGSYDSMVEYDRRRELKEQLTEAVISTCLDMTIAVGTLRSSSGQWGRRGDGSGLENATSTPLWEEDATRLEHTILSGDAENARKILPEFLEKFRDEPLLFTSLADGGEPRQILRARVAQGILRALVGTLPRLGLLRETYDVLLTARAMELAFQGDGRRTTQFNDLFESGYLAVVEAAVESVAADESEAEQDREVIVLLERLTRPFLNLWVEHSQTLRLTALDNIATDAEWDRLQDFVVNYGGDLFHAKFMTVANLRAVLHRGVAAHLEYLAENPDPQNPVELIDDIDGRVKKADAVRWLECVLQATIENYDIYKDYNTTTTQSDYGENLHILLEFLRLKVSYDRHAWRVRPLAIAHEVLARAGRPDLASAWQEGVRVLMDKTAKEHLEQLAELEKKHGMRLATVTDRLEEQFVRAFAVDRLCALAEPAMEDARDNKPSLAFDIMKKELQPFLDSPGGSGLDTPAWLRRLDAEIADIRAAQSSLAALADDFIELPAEPVSLDDLRRIVDGWDGDEKPAR